MAMAKGVRVEVVREEVSWELWKVLACHEQT